jgi:hypothetical protein
LKLLLLMPRLPRIRQGSVVQGATRRISVRRTCGQWSGARWPTTCALPATMAEIARMVKEQMEENGGCGIENYGPAHVRKDIEATIAWMQKQVTPSIEAYQQIELERIEKLVHTFWPEAVNGNRAAAQFIVTLHERLAKVLGTDAARKVSVEVDVRHTISRMAAEQGLSKSEEALAVEEALRIFAESKR